MARDAVALLLALLGYDGALGVRKQLLSGGVLIFVYFFNSLKTFVKIVDTHVLCEVLNFDALLP
jgi:hypothetical protein